MNTRPTPLLLVLLVLSSCAGHETLWIGDPPATWTAPAEPLPITVAVRTNSFESPRIAEMGVGHRFAFELSRSGLVWGVRYAPEEQESAGWELRLQALDHASEAAGNGRRAAWALWFPPAAPFVWLERSSVLELEAELLQAGESRGQYAVRAETPRFAGVLDENIADRLPEWTEDSFPGILLNVAAGRTANRLTVHAGELGLK